MITIAQFNDLVKNATIKWREGYSRVAPVAQQLYDVSSTNLYTDDISQIDGFTFAKRKREGGNYAKENPIQGYSLNITQTRFGLAADVTWEMRRYDKYREINKKMLALGQATAQRMELDLTNQFTYGMAGAAFINMDGESVSPVSADGQYIFSSSHTITGGSATISNKATSTFSRAGLEAVETLLTKFVNNQNSKIVVKPDTIVTTDDPALVNAVKEFLGSTQRPDNANNATNVYSQKYTHIILPYLSTTALGAYSATYKNYWFLADRMNTDAILEISENPTFTAPNPGSNGEDVNTDNWTFKSSASYDFGVLGYTWLAGSDGTV